jgi:probable rRNA maturation factor
MLSTNVSFVFTEKIANDILIELQNVSDIAVRKLNLNKLDISIIFVGEKRIKQLNKLYRKKDKTTDVLSFFYGNEGEIFINVQQATKQAKENQISICDELIKLIIHGFAHIAGHDHEKDSEYIKMSKVEKQIYDLYQKDN